MSGTSLEERVRDQLGFYPSYLVALEPTPGAADLVWAETKRVLTADWAGRRGEWLGNAVTATIEDYLPTSVAVRLDRVTFDEPGLQQTAKFFAFVLLRLGVGISAARYVLDGEETRLDHRERAPVAAAATTEAPTRWTTGAKANLPVEPSVSLVEPEVAPTHVAATYDYLTDALGTPNVNNIFRAFGSNPAFLTAVVDTQVTTRGVKPDLDHDLRSLYATSLNVDDEPPAFTPTDIDPADRAAVAGQLQIFHDNLATLLVTLYLGTRFLRD